MKNLVICDSESGYAAALASFLTRKKELALQVHICGSLHQVLELQETNSIHYFLVSAEFAPDDRKQIVAETHLVLTTTGEEKIHSHESSVFKYQPADKILETVYQAGNEDPGRAGLFFQNVNAGDSRIVGVFSPVSKVDSTLYALQLARRMADQHRLLFITTQSYVGVPDFTSCQSGQNLSDLLYFLRQENQNLAIFLKSIVQHFDRIDYVLPAEVSEDIKTTAAGEWIRLLNQIVDKGFYEMIIMDLSEQMQGLTAVFAQCSEVHLAYHSNECSRAVIKKFEEEISLLGGAELQGKFIRKEHGDGSSCR